MTQDRGYMLTVAVHGPDQSRSENIACAVLIDVVGDDYRRTSNLDELPQVFILEKAPTVATRVCEQMIEAGFIMYAQAPPDAPDVGVWPTSVRTKADLPTLLAPVLRQARESRLYPLALWALPRTREQDLVRTVAAFSALRGDPAIFADALARGAMRLTAFPSSLTLSVKCDELSTAEAWVRAATRSVELK